MSVNKKVNQNKIKPEQVIHAKKRVIEKPQKPAPKLKRVKPKKNRNKHSLLKILFSKKLKSPIFNTIVMIVLVFFVILTCVIVSKSIKQTNILLDQSNATSNTMYLFAKKQAEIIKIIGPKQKRQSEIVNFQSAPKDLQEFVEADYKEFKQQCIVNGKLQDGVSYEISNIIYDKFATVSRNCNGAESSILRKFDKKWSVVFSGNNLPKCSLINDLDIPQGASMYCDQNGVSYVNPNP